ncbi:L-lactate permease [Dysgonomonas sp. 216]|nr:L-lactate permease [Dysgonomonas sp. 216]NDW18515.1 L-lactate permease [Dysgonomonas sp. 216]
MLQPALATPSGFSILLAATPVLLLIVLLGVLKLHGDKSALITLLATVFIAIFAFDLSAADTGVAFLYGVVKAIFPILIIILMAIFSYNVLVSTKNMEIIKEQFSSISSDKSMQVLLLAWGFGGLLEGMAGFGTAVAIPAAILISLGFKPVFSAVACLIANSVSTAFGAIGTPVKALAIESGFNDLHELSANIVSQLSPLMFIVPFILVVMTNPKLKALPKNFIISIIVGSVSLGSQYMAALRIGPETPAIIGSLASIVTIIIFGKLTEHKHDENEEQEQAKSAVVKNKYTLKQSFAAWSVYAFILLLVIITSPLFPSFREALQHIATTNIPFEINGIQKIHHISWLTDSGTLLFLGSVIGGLIQGAKIRELLSLLWRTLVLMKKTIITVSCLIGLSTIMDFSGMITVLGVALALATGSLYPFFAPTIGCLGTFLTGSDTSSNILFGKLQTTVADQIGAKPGWLAAANTVGATGGKIISPQSIAIATSAIGQQGKEGEILKKALPYAIGYIIIAGFMAYYFA